MLRPNVVVKSDKELRARANLRLCIHVLLALIAAQFCLNIGPLISPPTTAAGIYVPSLLNNLVVDAAFLVNVYVFGRVSSDHKEDSSSDNTATAGRAGTRKRTEKADAARTRNTARAHATGASPLTKTTGLALSSSTPQPQGQLLITVQTKSPATSASADDNTGADGTGDTQPFALPAQAQALTDL